MTERRFHLSLEMPCLKKVPEDLQDHLGISEEEDIDLNQLQKTKQEEASWQRKTNSSNHRSKTMHR